MTRADCIFKALILTAVFLAAAQPALAKEVVTNEPILFSDCPDAADARVYLPTLEDGPGEGNFIYYRTRTFTCFVDQNGAVSLQPLDNAGKAVGPLMKIGSGIHTSWLKPTHYNPHGGVMRRHVVRYMLDITTPAQPTDKPTGIVRIRAKLMDGVEFRRRYKFLPDGIEIGSGFRCKNKDYPSRCGYRCGFPACMSFAPDLEIPERRAALKGYQVEIETDRDEQIFPYWDNTPLATPASQVDAVGPWGPRHFILKTKDAKMHPYMYAGSSPYRGYVVNILSIANKTTGKLGVVTVKIK